MTNENILTELRKPFHPSHVTWKPGMVSKEQNKALALAYADVRAYQNRLDEVCGMDWSVTYTPWGDKLVCHVTINGVTRSSIGEGDNASERAENEGTVAEAQAFKRACAMFGLGRYLYNLPSVWVEYDPSTKKFTDKAKAKLEGIIVASYRRTMTGGEGEPEKESEPDKPTEQDKPGVYVEALERLGKEYYADAWEAKRPVLVDTISTGHAKSVNELKEAEIKRLIVGIQDKLGKSKRAQRAPDGATA